MSVHWDFLRSYTRAIFNRRHELAVSVGLLTVVLVVSAFIMYALEKDAQPEQLHGFWSAFYWSASTVTTVGYGDIVPVTSAGRALSVVTSVIGAGFLVVTAGILASGFVAEMEKHRQPRHCPQCHHRL